MKFSTICYFLPLAAISLGTCGCGSERYPAYSENVKYGLRHDPVLVPGSSAKLGNDRDDPDRPGILPIMKFSEMTKPDHPYYPNSDKIDDKVMRDPAGLSTSD